MPIDMSKPVNVIKSYIPKPGDRVKIIGLHADDAHHRVSPSILGLVVTICSESPIHDRFEICYGFDAVTDTGDAWVFYAAIVEPIR